MRCIACARPGDERHDALAELGPYLALILVGFLPNEVWRLLGLVLVRGLDETSQIIIWVRAVATAMLAGVLAQLMLASLGRARDHPGRRAHRRGRPRLCRFLIARRSVFVGVLAGEAAVMLGAYAFAP